MRTVPRTVREKIAFFQSRLEDWTDQAEEIGSSDADVAELVARTNAARQAFVEQQVAQQQAQAATQKLKQALAALGQQGAHILSQIHIKARQEGNAVYPRAHISPPTSPSPIGAPGKPTRFTWQLQETGALELNWKCENPRGSEGTIYHIHRKVNDAQGNGAFEYLGLVGEKKFVDNTLPIGGGPAGRVTYKVIAMRSTASGPAAVFDVSFGTSRHLRAVLAQQFRPRTSASSVKSGGGLSLVVKQIS